MNHFGFLSKLNINEGYDLHLFCGLKLNVLLSLPEMIAGITFKLKTRNVAVFLCRKSFPSQHATLAAFAAVYVSVSNGLLVVKL